MLYYEIKILTHDTIKIEEVPHLMKLSSQKPCNLTAV